MVLVDYIGIFFTCCNTFGNILYNPSNIIYTSFIFNILHQGERTQDELVLGKTGDIRKQVIG